MRNLQINPLLLAIFAIAFFFTACEKENFNNTPGISSNALETRSLIMPELFTDWQSGDAYFECQQGGSCSDFAWKVNDNAPNGDYNTTTSQYGNTPTSIDNTITIYDSDGFTFSWTSEYMVCQVIVKAGPLTHVYHYGSGICGDVELESPINPNNGLPYEISHVSFCFNDNPCSGGNFNCYEEETAWAEGEKYNRNRKKGRGNWAMYVPYTGQTKTVTLLAGQHNPAGEVTLTPMGSLVMISIVLNPDYKFYYDVGDPYHDANIKIQDYEYEPNGNPAPGKFMYKMMATVGTQMANITVKANNYYGIHVDLAKRVSCE